MKKIGNLPSFLVVLFVLTSTIIPGRQAQAQSPSPTASVMLGTVSFDEVANEVSFDLFISLSNFTRGINAAEVYISYNASLVTPDFASLMGFFGEGIYSYDTLEAASCPGGSHPCLHVILSGDSPAGTKTGVAANFTLNAVDPAQGGEACFSITHAEMSDYLGRPLPDSSEIPVYPDITLGQEECVTIARSTYVESTVLRQGVSGARLACVEIVDSDSSSYSEFFAEANGTFSRGPITGMHEITAWYPGYLATQISNVDLNGGGTVILDTTTLIAGDTNNDGVINILDVGLILSKWGSSDVAVRSTSPNCTYPDESSDINDDGLVNISDLALLAGNWGLTAYIDW